MYIYIHICICVLIDWMHECRGKRKQFIRQVSEVQYCTFVCGCMYMLGRDVFSERREGKKKKYVSLIA